MARLTPEQIERLKEQGALKRAERAAKKAAKESAEAQRRAEAEQVSADPAFEAKLVETGLYLEHVYYKRDVLKPDKVEAVKALFLPQASEAEKTQAYQSYFYAYEILIFYAWAVSPELCDAAFAFWDTVLRNEKSTFSGNSIIRIMGCRPNENLLKIFKNHQQKFSSEPFMKIVMPSTIGRALRDGYFDSDAKVYHPWTDKEIAIWREILSLF